MDGGDSGIAADGIIKTYMLDYGHGFAVPKISHRSRMPTRSFRIISDAVVATVVVFLLVQCALQLAGKRNFNGWSQRRLAEQAATCKPKRTYKSPKKRGQAPRERQPEPRTPDTPPRSADASAAAESFGNEAHHLPSEEPRGRASPAVIEATAAAGGEQAEQAEAPAPDGPSGATTSVLSAGREDQKEEGQKLPDPCGPPNAAERKGISAADGEEAAQRSGYAMPFRSEGIAGVGGYSTGSGGGTTRQPGHPAHQKLPAGAKGAWADSGARSAGRTQQLAFPLLDLSAVGATGGESGEQPAGVPEQLPWQRMPDAQALALPAGGLDAEEPRDERARSRGTTEQPGHPAYRLTADTKGAWADPGARSTGTTQQLVFPWLDLSAVGATGGESGERQAGVPEQLPGQRMPDAQGPERPAGGLGVEEPRDEPAKSQEPTEAPAVRESGGALTAVQGQHSSEDCWGTGQSNAAEESPHRIAGADQQTAAVALTEAASPLTTGIKQAVASVKEATESFLQPAATKGWLYLFPLISEQQTREDLNSVMFFLDDLRHDKRPGRFGRFTTTCRGFTFDIGVWHRVSSPDWPTERILQTAAKYLQNFLTDVTALFENGDNKSDGVAGRSSIERLLELKTEDGDDVVGSVLIRLVGAEWVARWEHKEQLQDGGGNSS
ncbi:uncharacterized protein EMH_0013270 [Eimeria mitis]|uniref:Uncharacterized protein n=1 Tax=Eimeria mitis TaxID=44415 RepID=U6KB07_9EIME|nr:uncharacterized protein EMH_0013270 [Eimeria mitis]CDJ32673.1 hypothetical protein EMH_0013270 [Eimeria mitis]